MKLMLKFGVLCCTAMLSGCLATHSGISKHIKKSPVVTMLTKSEPGGHITPPNRIRVYYEEFNAFTAPDMVVNWERFYVIGDPSSPVGNYKKLAKIEVYLPKESDSKGMLDLKTAASRVGATALMDVYKSPLTVIGESRRVSWTEYASPIAGYKYEGVAIIEDFKR